MFTSCDAYSSVQGGERVCVKGKCVGAERVGGVGALQVARFRRGFGGAAPRERGAASGRP